MRLSMRVVLVGNSRHPWATTVDLNCSPNSRRARASVVAESRAIFFATALSSMAFTDSRSWYSKSLMSDSSFFSELLRACLYFSAALEVEAGFVRAAIPARAAFRVSRSSATAAKLLVQVVEECSNIRGLR